MNAEEKAIVIAHTQFVARYYVALKTSIEKIVELVRHSIGAAAPDADQISLFLRREATRKNLEYSHETALWQSTDANKSWRLVCLAVQTDPKKAAYLLTRRPPSAKHCSHCWIDESYCAEPPLIPEKDIYGAAVDNIHLHPQCLRPWTAMRRVVELHKEKINAQ